MNEDKYKQFEQSDKFGNNLVLPDNYDQKVNLV